MGRPQLPLPRGAVRGAPPGFCDAIMWSRIKRHIDAPGAGRQDSDWGRVYSDGDKRLGGLGSEITWAGLISGYSGNSGTVACYPIYP